MKIVGWINFENRKYKEPYDDIQHCKTEEEAKPLMKQAYEMEKYLVSYLREKGIKFSGETHQSEDEACTPVFDNGYAYRSTWRQWGAIVAEAVDETDNNPMSYMDWYMCIGPEEAKQEVLPKDVGENILD